MLFARAIRRGLLVTLLAGATIVVPARAVVAATSFTVDLTSDGQDVAPGDGSCDNGGGFCTLRAAVMESNALAGTDDITIPTGSYSLTLGGASEDASATGDLDITSTMVIYGSGPATVVNGGSIDRVLDVRPGGNLQLGYLDVTGGAPPGGETGGGIRVDAGTLFTDSVAVWGNDTSGGGTGAGIGTLNGATLQLVSSTLYSNVATGGAGGGVYSAGPADDITLLNATVVGNMSTTSAGGMRVGGVLTLTASTVASNDAPSTGNLDLGSLDPASASADSIVADPVTSSNCLGSFPTSFGGNFENGSLCGFTKPSDTVLTNPKLGAFGYHGGIVPTLLLSPSSPAIDAGLHSGSVCGGFDARGVPRPFGGACDPGAYEFATCFGKPVDVVGTNGTDLIKGTPGADVVMSLDQPDTVRGLGGNDRLCGGGLNDKLLGGPGKDSLGGGPGHDICKGGPASDKAAGCEVVRGVP